jgi:hypothetical protein
VVDLDVLQLVPKNLMPPRPQEDPEEDLELPVPNPIEPEVPPRIQEDPMAVAADVLTVPLVQRDPEPEALKRLTEAEADLATREEDPVPSLPRSLIK